MIAVSADPEVSDHPAPPFAPVPASQHIAVQQ